METDLRAIQVLLLVIFGLGFVAFTEVIVRLLAPDYWTRGRDVHDSEER